jgi:ribosomal protein S18 acetylase RimI-like enzyme
VLGNLAAMSSFVVETRGYRDPDVLALDEAVQAEYVTRYGGPDAVVDPAEFEPPDGLFVVGFLHGQPVASGGWRRLDSDVAELKRMYVVPTQRRHGLARRMLAELEERASRAGYRRLVLVTGTAQPEAIGLYRAAGYQPVSDFGIYAGYRDARFFGKTLRPAAVSPG